MSEKKSFGEHLDYFFNKILPKKFLVITVATIIVLKEVEAPAEYWWLLIAYFTGNVAMKFTPNKKE